MSGLAEKRATAVAFLESLGIEGVDHSHDGLLAHLSGTCDLLARWGNPEDVCIAGLCHAIYSTDGFTHALLDVSERDRVRQAIGRGAEEIAYFYGSCDRRFFYPLIGAQPPRYRDRFTDTEFEPTGAQLSACLEILIANDVEIAYRTPAYLDYTKEHHSQYFLKSKDLVSESAFNDYCDAYGIVPNVAAAG